MTDTITRNGCTAIPHPLQPCPVNQRLWIVRHGFAEVLRVTSKGRLESETFIFAADAAGRVVNFRELAGSCRGERSHAEAIAAHLDTLGAA
jgi:hypothetical protein